MFDKPRGPILQPGENASGLLDFCCWFLLVSPFLPGFPHFVCGLLSLTLVVCSPFEVRPIAHLNDLENFLFELQAKMDENDESVPTFVIGETGVYEKLGESLSDGVRFLVADF